MTRVIAWSVVGLVVLAATGPILVCVLNALVWPVVVIGLVVGFVRVAWFLTRR